MKELDNQVAETLNIKHARMADRINRTRKDRDSFAIGTQVWVYKPTRVGGYRLEPRWWGPAIITKRVGQGSYEVQWDEGETELVHLDDLKEVEEPPREVREGTVDHPDWRERTELFYKVDEENDEPVVSDVPPQVEKILSHRVDSSGRLELFVKWQGKGMQDATWELGNNIAPSYIPQWVEYCTRSGVVPT